MSSKDLNMGCFTGKIFNISELKTYSKANGGTGKFVTFSLGVCRENRKLDDGSWDNKTDWLRCISYNGQAEYISQYVSAKDRVAVKTEVRSGKYDVDGKSIPTISFVITEIDILEKAEKAAQPEAEKPAAVAPKRKDVQPPKEEPPVIMDFSDDDLPF